MFDIENVKEMINSGVFGTDKFSEDEVKEVVTYLKYAFEKYNNTITINGRLDLYLSDFKEELFYVESYSDIKNIDISLYVYSEITVTLKNGREYLISDCCDYYFNAGVTSLNLSKDIDFL